MMFILKVRGILNMKKKLFNLIKIIISISLIVYLFYRYRDDLVGFFQSTSLEDINIYFLVLAALMHLTGLLISSIRWKMLLKMQKVEAGINYLNASLLIGIFLNNFLPGSIGGDAYRAYDSSRSKNSSWPKAITVLLVERGTGVIVLLVFIIISLFLGFTLIDFKQVSLAVGILLGIGLIFTIFLIRPSLLRVIFKIRFMKKAEEKFQIFLDAFSKFKSYKKEMAIIMVLSFLMQFNVIIHYYFAALALNIEISFLSLLFMVRLVLLSAIIPISIGGLGVGENTTAYFLQMMGVSSTSAIALPLLVLILLILESIIGGFFFLARKPKIFS